MPLAGLGDGEKIQDLLEQLSDYEIKYKILIHIAKSLLIGRLLKLKLRGNGISEPKTT